MFASHAEGHGFDPQPGKKVIIFSPVTQVCMFEVLRPSQHYYGHVEPMLTYSHCSCAGLDFLSS